MSRDLLRWSAAAALLLVLLLAVAGETNEGSSRGRRRSSRRRGPSIQEHINMEAVQRVLSNKKNSVQPQPSASAESPVDNDPVLDFSKGVAAPSPNKKTFRSSRKALIITRREYLREDWCKIQPLKQKIRLKGCQPVKIDNNFCYGQCGSFYIPRDQKKGPTSLSNSAFKSCATCKPKRTKWQNVTLKCPGHDPPTRVKPVEIIKECRCMNQPIR